MLHTVLSELVSNAVGGHVGVVALLVKLSEQVPSVPLKESNVVVGQVGCEVGVKAARYGDIVVLRPLLHLPANRVRRRDVNHSGVEVLKLLLELLCQVRAQLIVFPARNLKGRNRRQLSGMLNDRVRVRRR